MRKIQSQAQIAAHVSSNRRGGGAGHPSSKQRYAGGAAAKANTGSGRGGDHLPKVLQAAINNQSAPRGIEAAAAFLQSSIATQQQDQSQAASTVKLA